jgi:hypothetical protein
MDFCHQAFWLQMKKKKQPLLEYFTNGSAVMSARSAPRPKKELNLPFVTDAVMH